MSTVRKTNIKHREDCETFVYLTKILPQALAWLLQCCRATVSGYKQKCKNTTEKYESHINNAQGYADVVRIYRKI